MPREARAVEGALRPVPLEVNKSRMVRLVRPARDVLVANPAVADVIMRSPDVAFIIGGADGLDLGLRQTADLVVAFGAMTWPHLLVRGMLVEQLYRAQQILVGHPYHRGDG